MTNGKPVEGVDLHIERDGMAPSKSKTNNAGKGEKITVNRVQKLKVTAYKKR